MIHWECFYIIFQSDPVTGDTGFELSTVLWASDRCGEAHHWTIDDDDDVFSHLLPGVNVESVNVGVNQDDTRKSHECSFDSLIILTP